MTQVQKIDQKNAELAHHDDQPPMMAMIERVLMNPDLPMERITALMDIQERQMNKAAEQAFNAAFAAAMAEMPDVPKSGKNNHTNQKYSTLDDLIRTARPVLSRHGLSLNWEAGTTDQRIWVKAIVRHSDGHNISTMQDGPRDNGKAMNALQGGGSTETYLKRYTGFAILGLASGDERDNDGVTANAQTISADQFNEITDLIEKIGINADVVMKAEGVSMLEEIPASKFAGVMSNLRITAKKRGVTV